MGIHEEGEKLQTSDDILAGVYEEQDEEQDEEVVEVVEVWVNNPGFHWLPY
jgi:hypothetical protein